MASNENRLTFAKGGGQRTDSVSREMADRGSGTSIFDPTLCELLYRWFTGPGQTVLDPFAGGSVRGIVASKLGRRYVGVELRQEQVAANRAQERLCGDPKPEWRQGDSRDIAKICKGVAADFVFSCPPYADLERYSDDPKDLSTLAYDKFVEAYAVIIKAAVGMLKPDRFACFVVGDIRDKRGFYRKFPFHTVEAFEAAGAGFYNEAVLVTATGSLPLRCERAFASARKLGKTHQNILVFCKGDPKKAAAACGPADGVDFQGMTEEGEQLEGGSSQLEAGGDPASKYGEVL
jgi:DNA modification methylase